MYEPQGGGEGRGGEGTLATIYISWARIDLRKARENELATLDGKSTSIGIAEPFAR